MIIVLAVMTVMGFVTLLPKPVVFQSNTQINLESSARGAASQW